MFWWIAAASLPAFSQFEGRPIVEVQYSPAQQPLDPQDLQQIQPVRAGARYRSEDIAAAIDRLFATGRYRDIQVDAEPKGDGVVVRFLTAERWFVGHVGAGGKMPKPPDSGQIIAASRMDLGTPFDEDELKTAEKNIRELLERNGLYQAEVRPDVERDPETQQLHFTFVIRPGKRARYDKPVIRGDTKLSENTIIRATGWRRFIIGGYKQVTEFRTQRGANDILKKYQSKDRLMASVELSSLDYDPKTGRVKTTFDINGGPKVKVRAVEAKVPKKKMKKYVPIYDERRLDRDLLVEGARNLRDYFQTQGYYDANVEFRERQAGADERVVEYVISRGRRYKLVRVAIDGNRYFDNGTIRERMFLQPASLRMRHGRYSEAFRKKDEENITNLYHSNGFRDVKVTSTVDRDYQGNSSQMAVTLHIDEGQQWFVDKLDIKGVSQIPGSELQSRISSAARQPYSDATVAADRTSIMTYYFENGFPDATFQFAASPAGEPNHVNLTYTITENQRQWVRDILYTGLNTTRVGLVDRNLLLDQGDPLSPVAMTKAQKQLYDLGVFARVNTAIQNREGQTQHKYALYDFEEANRYRVSAGFGAEVARIGGTADSLNAPAGATGFSPRASLELSRMNFLGLGHVVTLRGRFSTLQKRGSFNYLAPRFRNIEGRNITFTALYDNSRDVRTFQARREEASLQISNQFSKPTTGSLRLTYRRVSTSNVVIPTLLVPALLQPVRIGMISANLAQDRRDDPAETHKGIFNTFDLGLASRIFASQRSFVRGLARNATYHRLSQNLVLARELTFGSILPFSIPQGLARFQSIPLPERFFGGGSVSHRGFPENQAGPRDIGVPAGPGAPATQPTGFPLGGNALLFHMTELRFPLLGENIRGVFFHDAGNVYRSLGTISFRFRQRDERDFNYMVQAVGFGIRYKTPVGPIRLDLAYSINPPAFVGFKGTPQQLLSCNPSIPAEQLPGACQGVRQTISHFQFFFSIGQTF